MRRFLLAVAMALVAIAPSQAQTQSGFRMPSNNVFCVLEAAYDNEPADVRCDIEQTNTPAPPAPASCPLSWGDAFAISENGNSGKRICHGDTVKNPDLPVLPYGQSWQENGFSCQSTMGGVTCTNSLGHGFSLSRASQRIF